MEKRSRDRDRVEMDRDDMESRGDSEERRDREDFGERGFGGPRRPPRRFHRGKVCGFCVDHAVYIDYKDLERLRRYITDRGKILPRRITGNCAYHQRLLTGAIKRSRNIALIPFKAK